MKRYLMTFLTAIMTLCCAGAVFPLPSSGNSHDIASLHAWGPYSKRYAGISHIPDMRKGIRFDFSVMPGITGTVSWYRMSCSNHPTIRGK